MKPSKVLYEELLPHEFVAKVNKFPVAYLPLGTLEWHGKHLPLGADGIQAQGVFKQLATLVGGVVLPMLFLGPDRKSETAQGKVYYGMDLISFEEQAPQQLVGNAYHVEDDFFLSLLHATLRNLSRAGFKVVVAHGHGPSTNMYRENKNDFAQNFKLETFTLWDLGFEGTKGIQTDHAATNETSLVMSLTPDLTDLARLSEDEIPIGVWGRDPRQFASQEEGARLIESNIQSAAKKLELVVSNTSSPNLSLDYHSVKNLLEE